MQKRKELCSVLEDSNSDIAVLTETWLKPDVRDDELFPDHLNLLATQRIGHSNTVVVFLSESKGISLRSAFSYNAVLKITCVCLCSAIIKTILAVCYRPPNSDSTFTTELHKVLL